MHSAYITRKELARELGCSARKISLLHKQGLPRVYLTAATSGKGSRPRYDLDKVRAWLEQRAAAADGKEMEA